MRSGYFVEWEPSVGSPDGGERPEGGGAAGGQERQLSAWIIAVSKLHFWPLYFLLAEPVFSIGETCVYLQIGSTLKSPTAWQTFPATKSLNECILNQGRRSVDNSEIVQILLFSFSCLQILQTPPILLILFWPRWVVVGRWAEN